MSIQPAGSFIIPPFTCPNCPWSLGLWAKRRCADSPLMTYRFSHLYTLYTQLVVLGPRAAATVTSLHTLPLYSYLYPCPQCLCFYWRDDKCRPLYIVLSTPPADGSSPPLPPSISLFVLTVLPESRYLAYRYVHFLPNKRKIYINNVFLKHIISRRQSQVALLFLLCSQLVPFQSNN